MIGRWEDGRNGGQAMKTGQGEGLSSFPGSGGPLGGFCGRGHELAMGHLWRSEDNWSSSLISPLEMGFLCCLLTAV